MRSGKYYQGKKINGKKRDLHRLIAEQKIGRQINSNEVVHHINGDINDNRPENLQVMLRSEHSRLHRTGQKMADSTRRKLSIANSGKPREWQRKLTAEQCETAMILVAEGMSLRKAASVFGVTHTTLSKALKQQGGRY